MGRHDLDRRKAIAASQAEHTATVDEEIIDLTADDLNELSRAIVDSNELNQRADNVYAQIQRLGITPREWFDQLAHPTVEDSIIKDKLTDRWKVEMMSDDDPELDQPLSTIIWNDYCDSVSSSDDEDNPADWPEETADGHPWKLYADLRGKWNRLGGS